MQSRNILITRQLSKKQREYGRELGLNLIEIPALEFEFPAHWNRAIKTINEHPKSSWVFTSKNSVKALKRMLNSGLEIHPEMPFFAVGGRTQKALQKLGFQAEIPITQDAKHLAELIIEQKTIDSVIYFHGSLSRYEMSEILVYNDIEVTEVEVYKTLIKPIESPIEPVDAILFCSPSAVKGFRQGQGFEQPLPPLFAIGSTTAAAIKRETNQTVKIANQPSVKGLLRTVLAELHQKEEV